MLTLICKKFGFFDSTQALDDSNNPDIRIFRKVYKKLDLDLVNIIDHVKPTISFMIWAGIHIEGITPIITMQRDESSAQNGYSAWSYQEAVEDGLLSTVDGPIML